MADQDVIVISDSPSPPPTPPPPSSLPAEPDFLLDIHADLDIDLDLYFQLPADERLPMPPVLRSDSGPLIQDGGLLSCEAAVLDCFPDICPEFLRSQAPDHGWDAQRIITHLLDEQEKGQSYPKRSNPLKRKRPEEADEKEEDEEEEIRKKFEKGDPRLASKGRAYVKTYTKAAKALLKASFPQYYLNHIENTFKENYCQLYTTYLALDKALWSPDAAPARLKKTGARPPHPEEALRSSSIEAEMDALAAFDAARTACRVRAEVRDARDAEEKRKEQEEVANLQRAKTEGTIADCGCCYEEMPLNRMVHCNGTTHHWFCLECARRMAETAVGLSKYHLGCMSMDGCDATFSMDQKKVFLGDKLAAALELIEQEAVLRMAGIENLATCPFCPYAAEYPPVEVNKEFQCENPGCGLVTCRLCREETHIPKSCDEAAKERGHSARRTIEEAMSAALIRKCNKCGTPFIKENGCNKMTCTRVGCRNVQCYVCSKSCDYSHFDDSARGGKAGNCPLFDSVEQRHQEDVNAAEEEARRKVAEANPAVDSDLLMINFSDKVKQDDERRRAANPGPRRHPMPFVMPHPRVDHQDVLGPLGNWAPPILPLVEALAVQQAQPEQRHQDQPRLGQRELEARQIEQRQLEQLRQQQQQTAQLRQEQRRQEQKQQKHQQKQPQQQLHRAASPGHAIAAANPGPGHMNPAQSRDMAAAAAAQHARHSAKARELAVSHNSNNHAPLAPRAPLFVWGSPAPVPVPDARAPAQSHGQRAAEAGNRHAPSPHQGVAAPNPAAAVQGQNFPAPFAWLNPALGLPDHEAQAQRVLFRYYYPPNGGMG